MSGYALKTVRSKLESLPWRRLWQDKKFRFALLALLSNIVGYSLVYILTRQGVATLWANESVSKGMAPVGLALNSLALTGGVRPTGAQAARWTAWWVPSALLGGVCTALVASGIGLQGLECRAACGAMMFPVDYAVKRFVVFSKAAFHGQLEARLRLEECKAHFDYRLLLIRIGA